MRSISVYECKVGYVVLTGDNYGMSPCVCIKEKTYNEEYGFDIVEFLDLTTGISHESGGKQEYSLDSCYICDKISKEQVERIKQVWSENGNQKN